MDNYKKIYASMIYFQKYLYLCALGIVATPKIIVEVSAVKQ
jgi:hypothetical protein